MSGQLTDSRQNATPPAIGIDSPRCEEAESYSYLRSVVALLAARHGTWFAVLLASLFLNLCGLATPRITQVILDYVIPAEDFSLLIQLLLLLIAVTAFQVGFTIWRRWTLVHINCKSINDP